MDTATITKGEFARRRGVSKARVSQWLSEGKIFGEAIVGEGRFALIREQVACSQLEASLDVVQRAAHERGAVTARPVSLDPRASEDLGLAMSAFVERIMPKFADHLAPELHLPPHALLPALKRAWRAMCEVGR